MGANHVSFKDRLHAGQLLADILPPFQKTPPLILGLARGGVVVSQPIARHLGTTFDVLVIKKLSSPYNREFAIGAAAPDNVNVTHWKEAHRMGLDEHDIRREIAILSEEIQRQTSIYRKGSKPYAIRGKIVVLVDDGAATGATLEAAIAWTKKRGARKIIVAVPIISKEAAALLQPEVDTLISCHVVDNLESVGRFYESFPQVSDKEVIDYLSRQSSVVSRQSSVVSRQTV